MINPTLLVSRLIMINKKNTNINSIKNQITKIFEIESKQIYITASIGVAIYPKDGIDINTILKNADSAMYKAKELGKNRFARFDGKCI